MIFMIFHDHEYPSISINQIISPSNISNMHHYAPNDKAIHLHLQGVWSEIRPKRWATAASARSRPPGDTVTWLVTLEQSLDRPKSSKVSAPGLRSTSFHSWQMLAGRTLASRLVGIDALDVGAPGEGNCCVLVVTFAIAQDGIPGQTLPCGNQWQL
jgi:hypothetical protein